MKRIFTLTPEHLLPLVQSKFKRLVDQERCLILYDKINCFSLSKRNEKLNGASISMTWLRTILGGKSKTKIIIDTLKQLNVIKCKTKSKLDDDGNEVIYEPFSNGNYAKIYSICPDFELTKTNARCRKLTEKLTLKALFNAEQKSIYRNKLAEPEYQHIIENLNNVGIDYERAEEFIRSNFPDISNSQYFRLMISVQKIEAETFEPSRGSNGRLNTTLTNLKRELRQFLFDKVDGAFDFVEVDVSNSQPLLIGIYFENHYPEVKKNKDFLLWKEQCKIGKIYDYLSEHTGYNRAYVKERFFDVLLYTQKNKKYLLENKKWNLENQKIREFLIKFKELFPTIWDTLLKVKDKVGGNREFAIRIQRMEAELMIDRVLVELKDLKTNFSIHDSIVCKESDVELVKNRIKEAFKDMYNSEVDIKEKSIYS